MNIDELLEGLEYKDSPYFLKESSLKKHPVYGHSFRQAQKDCGLKGVYVLSEKIADDAISNSIIPVIYVCEATSEQDAREIHKRVWNQNLVPFLLVKAPGSIRIYKGFRYDISIEQRHRDDHSIIIEVADKILESLADFSAEAINTGRIWERRSNEIDQENRVDWKLLESLEKLGQWLVEKNLDTNTAHSLIGKYVYLRYLKDRKILSDRKFGEWGIGQRDIFGRDAKREAFFHIDDNLEEWLNGSVFPISEPQKKKIKRNHLQMVSATFIGDKIEGQMHLDFQAYSFEHIPIETLSIVYQQFLHSQGKGRRKGAYYTPIHLVNFILDEIEAKKKIEKGVKILDPSCGSGAFLVQCYRRLIEREYALNQKLNPSKLRELLTDHIFGIEIDEDACGITELSLLLTLLDYVDPPDLESYHNFKLPILREKNIFLGDFFDPDSNWIKHQPKGGYDLIVGNPPWKHLNSINTEKEELKAFHWIKDNFIKFPTGDLQIAEAFTWKISQHISSNGVIGLLLPASTLFKTHSFNFRQAFFTQMNVWCVVNFSNLRHVLFRGAVNPAIAVFYSPLINRSETASIAIITYSPFAISQINLEINDFHKKIPLWSIIVDSSSIRDIPKSEAILGDSMTWKISMWGTARDKRLLDSIKRRFPSLSEFCKIIGLFGPHEGPQFRGKGSSEQGEKISEIVGQSKLVMKNLKRHDKIFSLPDAALETINENMAFLRKTGGKIGLKVCYPPHIIVDASRRFSVYSDQFILVPPRQIGIAGEQKDKNILKCLSLYLSSDFAKYHQFLSSGFWGVERDRPNLDDLANIPIPFNGLSDMELSDLVAMHDKLVGMTSTMTHLWRQRVFQYQGIDLNDPLILKLNATIYDLLKLNDEERWFIDDFIKVKIQQNEGRLTGDIMDRANIIEISDYSKVLKNQLDGFLDSEIKDQHQIRVFYSDRYAIVKIVRSKQEQAANTIAQDINEADRQELNRLFKKLRDRRQWGYFDRCLRIYDGKTTYIFKPLQKLYWLKSQAVLDADEFIAEKLVGSGESS